MSPHAECGRCHHAADEHAADGRCLALYGNTANPCICAGFTTDTPATVESLLASPERVAHAVQKIAQQTFIADALGFGRPEPTPEQAAARIVQRARLAAETSSTARRLAAVRAQPERGVLDLHAPTEGTYPTCQGCDFDGYESEPPPYPCRTVAVIADHYGIPMPDAWVVA